MAPAISDLVGRTPKFLSGIYGLLALLGVSALAAITMGSVGLAGPTKTASIYANGTFIGLVVLGSMCLAAFVLGLLGHLRHETAYWFLFLLLSFLGLIGSAVVAVMSIISFVFFSNDVNGFAWVVWYNMSRDEGRKFEEQNNCVGFDGANGCQDEVARVIRDTFISAIAISWFVFFGLLAVVALTCYATHKTKKPRNIASLNSSGIARVPSVGTASRNAIDPSMSGMGSGYATSLKATAVDDAELYDPSASGGGRKNSLAAQAMAQAMAAQSMRSYGANPYLSSLPQAAGKYPYPPPVQRVGTGSTTISNGDVYQAIARVPTGQGAEMAYAPPSVSRVGTGSSTVMTNPTDVAQNGVPPGGYQMPPARRPSAAVSAGMPSGNIPSGTVPSGTIPSGNVPSGTVPSGTIPGGAAPNMAATFPMVYPGAGYQNGYANMPLVGAGAASMPMYQTGAAPTLPMAYPAMMPNGVPPAALYRTGTGSAMPGYVPQQVPQRFRSVTDSSALPAPLNDPYRMRTHSANVPTASTAYAAQPAHEDDEFPEPDHEEEENVITWGTTEDMAQQAERMATRAASSGYVQ